MTAAVSRAVMWLAICCLGEIRREWALAMRTEFEAAIEDGKPFAFAIGCLMAAWYEMPKHTEGRFVLANYALALGLFIPMAALQFALAVGFSSALIPGGGSDSILLLGATQNPYLAWSQSRGLPCLLALWLLLGMGHLRLAWVLVDRDWTRVVKVGALIAATTATLFILMGVLLLDVTFVFLQAAVLAIELTALVAVARGHARVFPDAALEMPAE